MRLFLQKGKYWVTAIALLTGAAMPFITVSPAAAMSVTCQKQTVPVHMRADDPATYDIVGWLCWQGTLHGKTVQLLQHGATYDHNYWDWPQQPALYSYVQTATALGYATFNIDRLGFGESDHPADPDTVTMQVGAYVASQIVQALRHGQIGGVSFTKVIAVGHSMGSEVSLLEASTYHDVDGVILTGMLHDLNPAAYSFFGALYPASLDPKFAGSGLAPGYLTTLPGTRAQFFYNTDFADPAVIAKDEQLKQTVTSGELNTVAGVVADPAISQAVHVPVLLVMGQKDFLFCDESTGLSCADAQAVKVREAADYSPQACLEAFVLPKAGHDTNLHPNAQLSYAAMNAWAYRRVGNGIVPPLQPCN